MKAFMVGIFCASIVLFPCKVNSDGGGGSGPGTPVPCSKLVYPECQVNLWNCQSLLRCMEGGDEHCASAQLNYSVEKVSEVYKGFTDVEPGETGFAKVVGDPNTKYVCSRKASCSSCNIVLWLGLPDKRCGYPNAVPNWVLHQWSSDFSVEDPCSF
jgi:hypothetical protein